MVKWIDAMGTSLKIGLLSIAMAAASLMASGCSLDGGPRPRLGCYATSTPGGRFIDANGLGNHSYRGSPLENNGIAYTCRGGHIDVTHARICADNTRYLYEKTKSLPASVEWSTIAGDKDD